MHDKGGITESLHVHTNRAGVRWAYLNMPTSLFEELIAHGMAIFRHGHIWRLGYLPTFSWTEVEMSVGTRLHVVMSFSLSCTGGISAYQPHGTVSLLTCLGAILSVMYCTPFQTRTFWRSQAPSSFQLLVLIMASWAGPEEEDTIAYVRKDTYTRPSPSIWVNLIFTFDGDQKTGHSLALSPC